MILMIPRYFLDGQKTCIYIYFFYCLYEIFMKILWRGCEEEECILFFWERNLYLDIFIMYLNFNEILLYFIYEIYMNYLWRDYDMIMMGLWWIMKGKM